MKDKFLLGICILLVVMSVMGCRKEPDSEQQQTVQQTEVSNQDGLEKSAAEKQLSQESITTIDIAESQEEEIEYFALFMEGKKVGYAIQSRDIEDDKVTTSVDLKITLSRAGVSVSVQTSAKTFETVEGKPLGFGLEQALGMMATTTTATIDEQGKVKVKTGKQEMEFDWPEGALM
jgi:hypothetical protein